MLVVVDMNKHVKYSGYDVGQDAEQNTDFKTTRVPWGDSVFGIDVMSLSYHRGACGLAGLILLEVALECRSKSSSGAVPCRGKDARQHVQDQKVEAMIKVPVSRSAHLTMIRPGSAVAPTRMLHPICLGPWPEGFRDRRLRW